MTLKPLGLALCALSLATPLIWFPAIAQGRDAVALFSQYLGIWALIAMALAQIISTRLTPVEALFGGLDRAYVLHKWLGIGAMVAILLHDTIDAEMRGLGQETLLVEVAETAGELSLYGLLILVVITIATFIPYHLWRWTHRLMGAFFTAGAFHYLAILKPFDNGDPLGLYTGVFCILGILAFAYRLLPSHLRPSRRYDVTAVTPTGNALAIDMRPNGRGIKAQPGQFAFFQFEGEAPHPFTLSAPVAPDGSLRISIAHLGDATHRLHHRLQAGAKVLVEGAYGRFNRPRGAKRELWIAGGIGITPFLAWAAAKQDETPVDLVYCVRSADNAAHLEELHTLAANAPNLTLHLHESASAGRLTTEALLDKTNADPRDLHVAYCGPSALREALQKGLSKRGLSQRRFHYELFEIRTGIGLRKLAAHLQKRITERNV